MDSEREGPSIVERIRGAGKELGVSRAEIEQEMIRLYQEKNTIGIRELFNVYLDWEIREAHTAPKQRTPEEIRDLASRNFDYIASVADYRKITAGDEVSSIVMATRPETEIVGPIRQFYRHAVGYNPKPPISQLN